MNYARSDSLLGAPVPRDPAVQQRGHLRSAARWRSLEALDKDRAAAAPLLGQRRYSLEDMVHAGCGSIDLGIIQGLAALFGTAGPRKSAERLLFWGGGWRGGIKE